MGQKKRYSTFFTGWYERLPKGEARRLRMWVILRDDENGYSTSFFLRMGHEILSKGIRRLTTTTTRFDHCNGKERAKKKN